jgi:hypothetical protein
MTKPKVLRPRKNGERMRPLTAYLCAAALLCVVIASPISRAAESAGGQGYNEYEVKAAFIFNFAKFVTWPATAFEKNDSPIVIGIVGKDPFGSVMDQIVKGKTVDERPFVIKRLKWGAEMKECHILFVSSSEKNKLGQMPELLKDAPVLTVSETPGFAKKPGMINFFMEEDKVKIEINADAAKRAKLTISSRLLSIVKIVKD